MATIGQQLLQPESGWKRIDSTSPIIELVGSNWLTYTSTSCYGGSMPYVLEPTSNNKIKFNFYGTKIRLIGNLSTSRGVNSVAIDGVTETYDSYKSGDFYQYIVYEKDNLPLASHSVEIGWVSGKNFSLDAIDMDDNGTFGFLNKFLISSSDHKSISVISGGLSPNLVPLMTSNTAPSGVVTSSGFHQSNYDRKVFDKSSTDNGWMVAGAANQWVAYEFPIKTKVTHYKITSSYTIESSPKNFRFEGSNDSSTWIVLDSKSNVNWQLKEVKEFSIDESKTNLYKSYRLFIESNNGHTTYTSVGELELFEYTTSTVIELPSNSEQNFINHGMDKSTQIDLNTQITNKAFVEQSPTTLGSGKIFSRIIDTSKTLIKKLLIK